MPAATHTTAGSRRNDRTSIGKHFAQPKSKRERLAVAVTQPFGFAVAVAVAQPESQPIAKRFAVAQPKSFTVGGVWHTRYVATACRWY